LKKTPSTRERTRSTPLARIFQQRFSIERGVNGKKSSSASDTVK